MQIQNNSPLIQQTAELMKDQIKEIGMDMEIQLIDDEGWPGKLADYQHTGSIYDVQPAKAAANKPIGEWNTVRIVCRGRKVTVEQNGKELVNANLDDFEKKYDKHPGLKREKGHIGFQSYNIKVEFRNVYLKEGK